MSEIEKKSKTIIHHIKNSSAGKNILNKDGSINMNSAESIIRKKYPNDDDDAIFFRFNAFLALIMEHYNLDKFDSTELCNMFRSGATFEEISKRALQLSRLHQLQAEEACQQIADNMAGGVGEYHGFKGKNNPERDSKGFERD